VNMMLRPKKHAKKRPTFERVPIGFIGE